MLYTVKNNQLRRTPLLALIIFTILISSYGDVVHLKSGGKFTGIITSEKNGVLTIDLGFGSTSVDTAEIASFERSNKSDHSKIKKQWQIQYYNDERFLPPVLKPFTKRLSRLGTLRGTAVRRKRELKELSERIDSLDEVREGKATAYIALNEDLKGVKKKGIYQQYELVGKAHEYNSSIVALNQLLKETRKKQKIGNPALLEYIDSLSQISLFFTENRESFYNKVPKERHAVITGIENEIQKFSGEFETAAVDVTFVQGNHIIVPVTINGKSPVSLLLDTGASSVTLSRAIATKLGINWHAGKEVQVTLANGENITGHSVVLRSVAVEDFKAAKVKTIVLEKPPGPGVDGLLGMTYLHRFHINIDAVNKKLVLRHFTAR